ncbi:hypothetical protein CDAR_273841 [Caerostris darwini]|uniref:Uncharacterized protein n=1 Tax=Caerostris darwini TaxID=1538125 RepID=A0AAV4RF24_9ARAC|nr:hypothetical protein CDAR_273841 [Caerostris darwini]
MLKQSAKSPSAAVLHSEDSVARGTPRGGRLRSPSGLSTLKPIKSFWTAPGSQMRPPLLTPLTVWSVCGSSPGPPQAASPTEVRVAEQRAPSTSRKSFSARTLVGPCVRWCVGVDQRCHCFVSQSGRLNYYHSEHTIYYE